MRRQSSGNVHVPAACASVAGKTCEKVGFEPRVIREGVKEGRSYDDVY